MKKLLLVLAVALAMVAVSAASAGGYATVGLSSLPEGTAAGQTWSTELTVRAHGRTPIGGLSPLIRIRNGADVREFRAKATGRTGVYRADVVFPAAGSWTYEVWDGYTRTHTFKPVEIGGPATSFPLAEIALWLGLAVALAAATLVLLRRRRPEPQPFHLKEAA